MLRQPPDVSATLTGDSPSGLTVLPLSRLLPSPPLLIPHQVSRPLPLPPPHRNTLTSVRRDKLPDRHGQCRCNVGKDDNL